MRGESGWYRGRNNLSSQNVLLECSGAEGFFDFRFGKTVFRPFSESLSPKRTSVFLRAAYRLA
ncbi:MAG: hypothetical protein C6P35_03945 [Cohnella sp.]|nr:MAG: hypothetical protein C6P35_03945 [Cohnella sp.]